MGIFSWLIVKGLPLVPKAIVGRVASRYVAGEKLEDALAVVEKLQAEGAMATLDLLGEEVSERSKATAAADEYVRMLDAIAARGLPSNVSIKLTSLGLKIDADFCRDNVIRIVAAAAGHGNFVRIDMEDHTTTDRTLAIYREVFARHQNVGVVFQAYMRRTLADIAALPADGANVRLCKGIYIEPRAVAWKGYETVRMNFLRALEKLLVAGVYVGIATHDEHLAAALYRHSPRPPILRQSSPRASTRPRPSLAAAKILPCPRAPRRWPLRAQIAPRSSPCSSCRWSSPRCTSSARWSWRRFPPSPSPPAGC